MTHVNEPNDDQYAGVDWILRDADGRVQRRTIVAGAAWTIPIVAVAAATPAAAASAPPTLTFTEPSYTGVACDTISGVTVSATTDGTTPDAGAPITVTLSDGYTFSDGSTTFTGTAGADGTLVLPDIVVPAGGGTSAFTATSGSLVAAAPVTAPDPTVAYMVNTPAGAGYGEFPGIPAGSRAIGGGAFLAPNGDLYGGNDIIASGVTDAYRNFVDGNASTIAYMENGVATVYVMPANTTTTYPAVPAGSEPLGGAAFLAPDGTLYFGDSVYATGVTSAYRDFLDGNASILGYVQNGVATTYDSSTGQTTSYPSVPANSTAIGGNNFLAPDGTLYSGNSIVATGVTSAYVEYTQGNVVNLSYVSNGVATFTQGGTGGIVQTFPVIPAGSIALGGGVFLAPNGDLYGGNAVMATNVTSAYRDFLDGNSSTISYVVTPSC